MNQRTYKWYLGGGTEIDVTVNGNIGAPQMTVLQKHLEALRLAAQVDAQEAPAILARAPEAEKPKSAPSKTVRKSPAPIPGYYLVSEAAKVAKVNLTSMYDYVRTGKIASVRMQGVFRIPVPELERYIAKRSELALKAAATKKVNEAAKKTPEKLNGARYHA